MTELSQEKKVGVLPFLGRGLIGGAIGGLVMILSLINPVTTGRSWFFWLVIAYCFFALPFGLFTGSITGVSIWLIHRRTGALIGPISRAGIGALISVIFWGSLFWIRDSSNNNYYGSSWRSYLIAVAVCGTTSGVLSGLIVGAPVRQGAFSNNKKQKELMSQ